MLEYVELEKAIARLANEQHHAPLNGRIGGREGHAREVEPIGMNCGRSGPGSRWGEAISPAVRRELV